MDIRVYRGVPNPESVADHSWRVAALCCLLHNTGIDVSKCMEMAILHDLAESITGDIAPGDNISKQEKARREHDAMKQIVNLLKKSSFNKVEDYSASQRFLTIMEEYETRHSKESQAVKDLDLLDMIIQADEYEAAHDNINLQEFFDGTGVERFRNAYLKELATEVHRQRNVRMKKVEGLMRSEVKNLAAQVKCDNLPERDLNFAQEFSKEHEMPEDKVIQVVLALRKRDAAS